MLPSNNGGIGSETTSSIDLVDVSKSRFDLDMRNLA